MRTGHKRVAATADWIDGDFYLHVNSNPMLIQKGSRQRALPCIACATSIGSQKCYMVCLVAGILCPNDSAHINAVGMFCHVRCLPRTDKSVYEAVIRAVQAISH